MSPAPDHVRTQLERLLASPIFVGSARLRRFLEFVVEKSLAGEGDRLKEYVIGVEVFDRDAQYDPRVDSIVRVEAARLRAKLTEYYQGEGRDDTVVLTLPKGGYAPLIRLEERVVSTLPAASAGVAPTPALPAIPPGTKRVVATAALLVVAAAAWFVMDGAGRGLGAQKPRVAVLPFRSYSDDDTARVLAEQLTDGVTAEFVRGGELEVVPSTRARQLGAAPADLRDVATALAADVLIEANVRTQGDRVLVEARAISGDGERKIWVDSFASTVADLDTLERDVATRFADAFDEQRRTTR
jgi:TolB-like protein